MSEIYSSLFNSRLLIVGQCALMIICFFFPACSGSKAVKKSSITPIKVVNTTIAKYDGGNNPQHEPGGLFSDQDREVVSFVALADLTGTHYIRWDWYAPNGDLYQSTGNYAIKISKGRLVKKGSATHAIDLKGTEAAKYHGRWNVEIYLDDRLAVIENFRVQNYYALMAQKRARTVLSSGGVEPVTDSDGKGGHSVFAAALIDILSSNEEIINGRQLFDLLRRPILLNADQIPEYSDLDRAGHDGGDFLFVPAHLVERKGDAKGPAGQD